MIQVVFSTGSWPPQTGGNTASSLSERGVQGEVATAPDAPLQADPGSGASMESLPPIGERPANEY